jgi:hypothetical protein
MHRSMVNIKTANIFKGIFETQKSTRNGKNNAKMRALVTWRFRIYHAGIKQDRVLRKMRGLLRHRRRHPGSLQMPAPVTAPDGRKLLAI